MSEYMFSFESMPSTSTMLSAYTTVAGLAMLLRTIANELNNIMDQFIPVQLREQILSFFGLLYAKTNKLTVVINEYNGFDINQIYEATEIYLRTKITNPSLERLRASKHQREKDLTMTVEKDQVIHEDFEGVHVEWELISPKSESGGDEKKYFELRFEKAYKEVMLATYLPYILERAKSISEENKVLKLHSLGYFGENDGEWGSVNFDHPITFNKLAMDPELKKKVLDDLDRFVKRRDFYGRVRKPWKRGYLLYGPPGTGKSSLIAAMANYLNFHIYDIELANLYHTTELRRLLVSTKNKSIIVIEDIDCSVRFHDRENTDELSDGDDKVTLAGMLNFIDGLWSSCGDERIFIFTTNYKDKLDPALLRPGRMDMHIHMSYCTPPGFRLLASNYLHIEKHSLIEEIENLLGEIDATPAEVAEQLMQSDEPETCLEGLIEFLEQKNNTSSELNSEDKESDLQSQVSDNIDIDEEEKVELHSTNFASYIFFGSSL